MSGLAFQTLPEQVEVCGGQCSESGRSHPREKKGLCLHIIGLVGRRSLLLLPSIWQFFWLQDKIFAHFSGGPEGQGEESID